MLYALITIATSFALRYASSVAWYRVYASGYRRPGLRV